MVTTGSETKVMTRTWGVGKWGGVAAVVLAAVFVLPEMIYLMGNLREANGRLAYDLADFLYGPFKAACLVLVGYAVGNSLAGEGARRLSVGQMATLLAAGMFVAAALLRASNRHYHLAHPELHLENSQAVLLVWTTLVGGVINTAWHFLGWALLLVGSVGWKNGRWPGTLCIFYWIVGGLALFAYLRPDMDLGVAMLTAVLSLWQGFVLWRE